MTDYTIKIRAQDDTGAAIKSANQNLNKLKGNLGNTFDTSSRKGRNFRQNVQQVGYQLQDFAVQVQGGTSALVAFSQQGSQLAGIFGAKGALIGAVIAIGSALAGAALPALLGTKKATDALAKSMEELNRVASFDMDGITKFKDEIMSLAEVSQIAANARITSAIVSAENTAKNASQAIRQEIEKSLKLDGLFFDLEGAVESARAFGDATGSALVTGVGQSEANAVADRIGEKFGLAGKEARNLGAEIVNLIANLEHPAFQGEEGFNQLENRFAGLLSGAGKSKDEIALLIGRLSEFFDKGRQAARVAEDLQGALANGIQNPIEEETFDKVSDALTDIARQVTFAQLALNDSTIEAEKLQFALANGVNTFEELPESARALFNVLIDINAQQEEKNALLEEERKAQEELKRIEDRKKASLDSVVQSLQLQVEGLENGKDAALALSTAFRLNLESAEQLPVEVQNLLDKIAQLQQEDPVAEGGFFDKLKNHIKETTEDFDTMWGNSFDRFAQGIGDSTASAIVEGKDFSETMKTFARSALQEVISGLIQIGIKRTALSAIESALTAKSTAETIAATTAIGTATTAAMIPAAAATSAATAGTNAAPAISSMAAILAAAAGFFAVRSFDGGGYTGNGARIGGVDGKGGELALIHPREVITDLTKGQSVGSNQMTYAPVINGANMDTNELLSLLDRDKKRFTRMVQAAIGVPR